MEGYNCTDVRGAWLYAGALAVLACASGCDLDRGQEIAGWTLVVDGETTPVVLPGRVEDHVPNRTSRYELRAHVPIEQSWRGQPLTVSVPFFSGKTELAVAGATLAPMRLGYSEGYRDLDSHAWNVPAPLTDTDALDVVIRVEHNWLQSAWWPSAPRVTVGLEPDGHTLAVHRFVRWSYWICLGTLVTIAFTSLLMFGLDRRRQDFLTLAIQCAAVMAYPLFHLGITAGLPARVDMPLLGLFVSLASISAVYTAYFQVSSQRASRFWPALAVVNVVVAIAASDPFVSSRWVGTMTIISVVVTQVYVILLYANMARGDDAPPGTNTLIYGTAFLLVFCAPDALFWTDTGDPLGGPRSGSIGLTVFAFAQFAALGQRHVASLRHAEQRGIEIGHLNDELRRQVAERSKQLSEALARLSANENAQHELHPGDEVDRRYRIECQLGAGAMGQVFRVKRTTDGRDFALKVLSDVSQMRHLARFAREAQLASEITHENVVGLVDVAFAESGFMYLVMELVEGVSLKEAASHYGNVDWALPILAGVSEGLAALHDFGVVHRDLKPANVLLPGGPGGDGRTAKITDFGVSRGLSRGSSDTGTGPQKSRPAAPTAAPPPAVETPAAEALPAPDPSAPTRTLGPVAAIAAAAAAAAEVDATATLTPTAGTKSTVVSGKKARGKGFDRSQTSSSDLTQTGALLGTPAYMAPELAHGANAEESTDVFSLGVMAFEMLVGQRPFDLAPVLMAMGGSGDVQMLSLRETAPTVAPAVAEVVDRALSLDPAKRPSARELADVFASASEFEQREPTRY